MRSFFTRSLAFLVLSVLAVAVSIVDSERTEPEIVVQATFPEENPFGHIVNGERNQIYLLVENKSDQNVTLTAVGGSFHHAESSTLLKNTTTLPYGIPLLERSKIQIPYAFYSEFKPGDLRLNLWLEHSTADQNYRVIAFDSIVTIVEPEGSWLDYKLISTYLIVFAFLGGASYLVYLTYFPAPKAKKSKRTRLEVNTPVSTVTTTASGAKYEEEWIPEHHLKKPKARKNVGVSSGDEVSGGETSGTDGRKRKGRK